MAATVNMSRERATGYRITLRRSAFHVEAVTADGAIDIVATWPTEDQAVRQLRDLQHHIEHRELELAMADEAPRGPRGRMIGAR